MWKPAPALGVSRQDQEWLETLVRSGQTPQRVALQARMVLGAAQGRPNRALAKELGISRPTLLLWRQRYAEAGVAGRLKDAPRPGRQETDSAGEGRSDRECHLAHDARGRDALERAHVGQAPAREPGDGASDLASAQSPAPSRRDVQAQPRSGLRAQGAGHRRPLSE